MADEIVERNEIRVAGKPIGTYAWECICIFRRFDQLTLSTSEAFKEKTQNIIDGFASFGVMVDKDYRNGKVAKWKNRKVNIINERTGRREERTFFIIGLTKDPNTYMYTDEERKVDIE